MKRQRLLLGLALLVIFGTIAVTIGTLDGHSQEKTTEIKRPNTGRLPIAVRIRAKAGDPFRLNLVGTAAGVGVPEINFTIENVGEKTAIAYVFRMDQECDGSIATAYELHNILSRPKIVFPRRSVEHVLTGSECVGLVSDITLSIDYVEFSDGSSWGEDSYRASERLAGLRAGARDETKLTESIMKSTGSLTLGRGAENARNIVIPPNHTEAWMIGYKNGRDFRLSQIEKALSESGIQGVRILLSMPYDASGKEER